MSYETERKTIGREAFTRIEIDMPVCALTYGVSPCSASLPVGSECKNTRNTCQDTASYDGSAVNTLTLCDSNTSIQGVPMRPLIINKKLSPTLISKKKALGRRAKIDISCRDCQTHDRDFDKYHATRNYIAEDSGTFWGKIKAIYKFYHGSPVRIITGYIGSKYDPADSVTRNYILESIDGPKKGVVKLTCLDILKLADDKRALCPRVTTGSLLSILTDASTLPFTLVGGAGQYPASGGKLRIENEIIGFTSGSISGDDFIVSGTITRGYSNTKPAEHDIGSTAQLCKETGINVVNLVYELLTDEGNIPLSYIDLPDWEVERDLWMPAAQVEQIITKSVGVTSIIEELSEAFLFKVWWDELSQKVRFKATSPFNDVTKTWNDTSNIIGGHINITEETNDRLSRVIVHFAPSNPIDHDKPEHFKSVYAFIDGNSEGSDQYGDIRTKEIFSRFISFDGLAVRCASRTLSVFKETPKLYDLQVDAKDSDVKAGDGINLSAFEIQDVNGGNPVTLMQVMSVEEVEVGHRYRYRLSDTTFAGRYGRIMSPGATNNYSSASGSERDIGCYLLPAGLTSFSNDDDGYRIL